MITLVKTLDTISSALSLIGVFIVLVAGLIAFYGYLKLQAKELLSRQESDYTPVRNIFIEKILLSLDFFVGADLVRTIAAPSFNEVGLLAAIVAIRIALSFSLRKELQQKI